MQRLLQLNPPLWFDTPKGLALAHFLIDEGMEADIQWVCFQQDSGEVWTWDNSDVRAVRNITLGRRDNEAR